MARTIKSLSRMSMAMRNLGTLTNYTTTKQFSRMSVYCLSNYDKESLISPRPFICEEDVSIDSKSLWLSLKKSRTPDEIFQLVKVNKSSITETNVVIAFKHLIEISENQSENIYQNQGFLTLCEVLKNKMRGMTADDCLTILKAMVYFNVPTSSIIVQMILQMLRQNLDTLRLGGLAFLDLLLQKCSTTPLVTALKEAVPIVYETKLAMELNRDSILNIKNTLVYLSNKSANPESYNIVIHALMDCMEPIQLDMAESIMLALCKLKCKPDELPEALKYIQDILTENISDMRPHFVLRLVRNLGWKIGTLRQLHYYHEGFLDACASKAISENWPLEDALPLLYKLKYISHVQISLLDYVAGKYFEDRTLLEKHSPERIASLVDCFAQADYKPVFWDVLQESIINDRILETNNNPAPLTKLALNLLALDVYWPKILEKSFENYLDKVNVHNADQRRTLALYQVLKTLYPQYSGPWPCNDVSELEYRQNNSRFPLLTSLEAAIGGSTYVITNIRTKLGHHIDHAVILRKGGFPVAVNKGDNNIEEFPVIELDDIKPPADSQVILILFLPASAYALNTLRMKGTWLLEMKSLETLTGYTIVSIGSYTWNNLSDSQKIPYLMQAIKLKCDEHSLYASS